MDTIETDDIRREDREGQGRYVRDLPGGDEAYLTFVPVSPDHIIIDYSFVPPAHRGRNAALPLIRRAVEDARAAGAKITPMCGYVSSVMKRHPEWDDVLKR